MANLRSDNPTNGQREDTISRLLRGSAKEDPALRAVLIRAVASRGRQASDSFSRIAIAGLLGLTSVALVGTLYMIADGNPETKPELPLAAFVGLLGGLLGLVMGASRG